MPPPLLVGNFTASGLDLVNGAGCYVWCVAALAAPNDVDAALDEVINLQRRRQLVDLIFTPGTLQLDDPVVMAGAWR